MSRWISAAVLATAAVVVGVAMALVVTGSPRVAPAAGGTAMAEADEESAPVGEERAERSQRHGLPAWAHQGHGGPPPWAGKGAGKPSEDWRAAWRDMSPRQRERMMTGLAGEHAAGMRAFGRCVADGRDDCDKPLPPGLAKKEQLGR